MTSSVQQPQRALQRIRRTQRENGLTNANRFLLPKRRTTDWAAVGLLLIAAACVFFINLTASGYANEFYSAAAQAGSKSWKAFLWGSLDSGNAITVDKPPASLWFMALSVRLFGLNSFAILLPQALMGVTTIYLIYALVRRYWGNWAGIIAGASFITTPVTALMFRFNNPDALLVLLMVAACYAVMRSLELDTSRKGNRARTRWMILAGMFVGFGFLTKQLQVMLILPGIAVAFLLASPTKIGRRILDSLAAIVSMIISAGWWVLLTVIVPASDRPYIGGSQNNSFLELTFGYNGFGRLTGNETGSVVPGDGRNGTGANGTGLEASGHGMGTEAPAGGAGTMGANGTMGSKGGMWGETGWTRLFGSEFAGQITWLALFALAGLVIGLILSRKSKRTSLRRASTLIFGGWLLVTWLTFSFMSGIFHAYYTVALAPAIAVLTAIAIVGLWSRRSTAWAPLTAGGLAILTSLWSHKLVSSANGYSALATAILICGILGGILLILPGLAHLIHRNRAAAPAQARDLSGPARSSGLSGLSESSRLSGASESSKSTGSSSPVGLAAKGIISFALVLSAFAVFAGPTAWTLATISTGHQGSMPTAGPQTAGGFGGIMGGPQGKGMMGSDGSIGSRPSLPGNNSQNSQNAQGQQMQQRQQLQQGNQMPQGRGFGQGQPPSQNGQQGMSSSPESGESGTGGPDGGSDMNSQGLQGLQGVQESQGNQGSQGNRFGFGPRESAKDGMGGGLNGGLMGGQGASTNSTLVSMLKKNASSYRWVAATVGSQSAAGYQLASEEAVMAIGGFNGSDNYPTLAQFKEYVSQGLIHYFIAGGGMGGQQNGGSSSASAIAAWVAKNFTAKTVNGTTVYNLTKGK